MSAISAPRSGQGQPLGGPLRWLVSGGDASDLAVFLFGMAMVGLALLQLGAGS
jgi:hypothetical protein